MIRKGVFRYASPFDKILLLTGSLVAMATGVGMPLMSIIMAICFLTVCENLVNQLRREFFKAIMRQDITWFDKNHSGTLATKLFEVKEGTGDKLGLMIQFVAQFFGGFIVAFTYDWKLTLIMMSLAPFMIICGAFIAKLMATAATREAKKYAVAGGIAEEVLTSMRTSLYIGLGLALTFAIMFSSYCLAFWVGTDFVFKNEMQGGTVMTVFFSVMMGSMALGQAGPQFAVLGTAMGAAGSLYQIIDREPEIDAYSTAGIKPSNLKGKISVSNLKFTYPSRPDVPILKGVSFEANPGQTIALVGSSGCGKSTIIQLLLRYYDPADGKITIDGVEIDKINIEFLRNYIAVVSQEPVLFNTTIEQNIRYGRENVTEAEITAALRKANAYNFVQGFPDASKGRTTIVIAHRLSTIRNADKIIAMKDGEVVEVGTHDELISRKGLYHELVNAQVFADIDEKGGKSLIRNRSISSRRSSTSSLGHPELKVKSGKRPLSESSPTPSIAELEEEGAVKANLFKILKYARPEWPFLFLAVCSSVVQGCVFPAFSLFFTQIIEVFSKPPGDPDLKSEGHFWALMFLVLGGVEAVTMIIQCFFFGMSAEKLTMRLRSKPPGDPDLKSEGHFWALMFLVLGGVEAVTMIIQCFFFGMSAEKLTMRLRSKVFHNVMRMDATYFDMPRHSPGKITTRLATDAPNVKSAIDFRLGSVFNSFVSVCSGIGIAFYYGWQMALLTIAIFPLAGVGQAIQMKFMSGRAGGDAKEMENSGKIAMEAIENIRTVQALTLEHRLHHQFCRHLDGPHKTSRRRAVMQ
ncbi:unnamed protein product, partial [Strongylus vulgaris]